MLEQLHPWYPSIREIARNLFFDLLGAAGLMLKRRYSGPFEELVWSYGGNIVASFATYFVVANLPSPPRFRKLLAAGLALAVVELFEATNGFGLMMNTYDVLDFAANAVGIALALAVDSATSRIIRRPSQQGDQRDSGKPVRPAV